jgi:hypothetical protein
MIRYTIGFSNSTRKYEPSIQEYPMVNKNLYIDLGFKFIGSL